MIDECLMTEECPGYDRDRRVCLLRPGDCEFRPADDEAAPTFDTPEALSLDAPALDAPALDAPAGVGSR
jgi:hypothetical protein